MEAGNREDAGKKSLLTFTVSIGERDRGGRRQRVGELMGKPTAATEKSRDQVETFLTMQHVDVARGESIVLHNISLEIGIGEHVAILGPNGCGKSTLLKTLTCECYPLVRPETRVRILGRERWDLTLLKRK